MKILILTWRDLAHPAAGGAEVYTEQVAANWAARGIDVTVLAASVEGRPHRETINGYQVVRVGGRFTVYSKARRWWRRVGQHEGYDLVIDMINTVPFFAHHWIKDIPTVAFAHQTCEDIWPFNAPPGLDLVGRYVLEPRWLREYEDVPTLVVSDSTRAAMQAFGLRDLTVVPEGIVPPELPAGIVKEDRPTVVWCARMVPYKRPADMVAAAELAAAKIPELQVWLIGGGPLVDEMRAKAPANVEVLGRVSEEEKTERMARAHLHVSTSLREGWGLVVSEAAALGTPTLAYDVPGLRDSTKAAGGISVPATPEALATWLPFALDKAQREDFEPLPYGGAHSWDYVADEVLAAVIAKSGLVEVDSLAHAV